MPDIATPADPLLVEVPTRLLGERLLLRRPLPGDGPLLNAAVCDSLEALRPWMPWAQRAPTPDESEAECRRMHARFGLREDLVYFLFARDGGDAEAEGPLLGAGGLHRIDWALRNFEIGYWRRSGVPGRGLVAEAVRALTRLAFDRLEARRVEIRADRRNERSRRVAERAGFTLEGVLRRDRLAAQGGETRDTCVYARVRGEEEA